MKSARCAVFAFVAICVFGSFRAVAQDTDSQTTASSAEGADAFVDHQFCAPAESQSVAAEAAANLTLTDREATKFGPVYDQYSTELSAALKGVWPLWLGVELRRKYVSILRKVLDDKKSLTTSLTDRLSFGLVSEIGLRWCSVIPCLALCHSH